MPFGAQHAGEEIPGDLFVIGGAEDKLGKRTVLKEFVERAGGADARIAVVPTASSLGPEIIEVYAAVFARLGASEVYGVRPDSRSESADPALVAELDRATGIFMTGGNQLKLSSVVAGTPFGDAIVAARERGVTIAGTSAGASIQSSHMVAFGPGGSTPKQRMTQVAAGLGLVESCVIDQHFAQRNRYGRLLMIVSQSPQLLGMGVDEDTAAVITRTGGHRDPPGDRPGVGDPLRRSAHGHQRPRGEGAAADPRLGRGAARAAGRRGVRPGHPGRWSPRSRSPTPRRPTNWPRPTAICARWPETSRPGTSRPRCCAAASPDEEEPFHDRRQRPGDRRDLRRPPLSRPGHHRDPGLPRRQRLVLRQGDPPRRGPRRARGVPHQHPARLHRAPARGPARPPGALLLPRTSGWLRGAAQRGHLARTRRRARRARPPAGRRPRHPARQDPRGQGREGPLQHHLRLRRRAGRARGRSARRTSREPPGQGRSRLRLRGGARRVHPARPAHRLRTLDAGDPRRGGLARHPVDPAQQALARAARPGRPRQADPRHHDLGDQLDRGRHRLRQGPHHPSPRCCRPARAQAGLRAYGGPGGHRREADRLPGRGQAARRQPRSRGLPEPAGRGRRARGLPDREGPVATRHGDRRVVRDRQGLPLPDHRRQGGGHRRARAGARDRRRHQLGREAGRPDQRRPATRRGPREDPDPDQDRRRRRGGARRPGALA